MAFFGNFSQFFLTDEKFLLILSLKFQKQKKFSGKNFFPVFPGFSRFSRVESGNPGVFPVFPGRWPPCYRHGNNDQ